METIWLQRPSGDIPWGFRLQGGREFAEPLSVQRVTPGTVAANGLCPGDVILKIGHVNATNITHNEAQDVITGASNILQLTIQKKSASSVPVSPTSSAPQYSEPHRPTNQYQSYDNDDKYQTLPDYRVGSGYQGYSNVKNSGGYNSPYGNNTSDPYDMRQFEQTPPISGYSTLPAKSGNRQISESFRPVQQQSQQKYPFKSTTGIQLQMNPQVQSAPQEDYQRPSYNDNVNYNQSQPMSPIQQHMNNDPSYQRQTSVGSNRPDTNNGYPQSYYKKPTPFSPTCSNNQNDASTPPRLTRQTSQGTVHDSSISNFQPGSFLPKSDDAPPPPPPPTNYQPQPELYRQPSYEQSAGRPSYPRQNSKPGGPDSSPYGQPQNNYNQYPNRNQGMYVDTSDPASRQYDRQGSRPYEPEVSAPNYQRQPSNPQYYEERNEPVQRQTSFGSHQQQPLQQQPPIAPQYGVYTPTPTYNRQPSREQQQQQFTRQLSRDQAPPNQYSRQSSRDQHIEPPTYNPTSPPGNTINSFDDILSPFENFQNSNYCDKLFARDNRGGDADSGVISDLNSDTPRSNQSSYSPQQSYPGGYNPRGEVQPQNLLRPAPPAPPPPATTPPPPPPPPPPSNWAPTPQRKPLQEKPDGGESQMPDKVLNTMLKHGGTQKPFAYVPTGTDLKEFKERARQRRQPRSVMPRGYTGPAIDPDDVATEMQQTQSAKPKPGAMPTPQSGVYKHAQYNSPLKMYSGDNAKEAFNIQSGGSYDVSGVNNDTPERRPSDIKDSEVYKMCQAADAKGYKPKKPRDPLLRHNSEDDEMRFSGLHTKADIPSKAFRMLNKIAGTENDSPNQESARDDNDDEPQRIGNYDEASIRYRGNHIPSPSFRLLQTLAKEDEVRNKAGSPSARTNTDEDDDGLPDKLSEEDMVDRRYKGGHIPSRSFKALQMFMDDDKHPQATEGEGDGPKIKVISRAKSPKIAPKPGARGVNSPVPNVPQDAPATEF